MKLNKQSGILPAEIFTFILFGRIFRCPRSMLLPQNQMANESVSSVYLERNRTTYCTCSKAFDKHLLRIRTSVNTVQHTDSLMVKLQPNRSSTLLLLKTSTSTPSALGCLRSLLPQHTYCIPVHHSASNWTHLPVSTLKQAWPHRDVAGWCLRQACRRLFY